MSPNALAADLAGRRAAQTVFDHPVVLEAGAGTGKTATLVARILAWSLGPGWGHAAAEVEGEQRDKEVTGESREDRIAARVLRGVVAVTFTEAAAHEMEVRLAASLGALATGDPPPVWFSLETARPGSEEAIPGRASALLGVLDEITIQTIHAFCRSLLLRYPLEGAIHPDLVVDADGHLLEGLVREVLDAALREAYLQEAGAPLLELPVLGIRSGKIVETIVQLVAEGLPAEALARSPFSREVVGDALDRLRKQLDRFLSLVGDRLAGVPGGSTLLAPRVIVALRRTRDACEALDPDSPSSGDSLVRHLGDPDVWPANLLNRLATWGRSHFTKGEGEAVAGCEAEVADLAAALSSTIEHLGALDPHLLELARRALQPLLREVESRARERGIATFGALLRDAAELLRRHPRIAAREGKRIRQLLVDEFQDTDQRQCDILLALCLDSAGKPRGGLFVVGDPKQSIYGWRNADLEAYEGFLQTLEAAGGRRYPLHSNFRSKRGVLEEVERVIASVMREEPGLQPAFAPLEAAAEGCDAPLDLPERATVEYWVSWVAPAERKRRGSQKTAKAAAAELEAAAVAADISDLHHRHGIPWRQFGVLLRGRTRLGVFLDAFRDAHVPFLVAGDREYFQRREVIEAAALVRAIVNPADHLSLLTLLRSPLAGVPDAALIPLWRRGFPGLVTELNEPSAATLTEISEAVLAAKAAIPDGIPGIERIEGWEETLLAAVESLAVLRTSFASEPHDVFLERLRALFLCEVTEAARHPRQFRLANLEHFFHRMQSALDELGGDFAAILRTLHESVARAREAEEALPPEAAQDAVQLLTIHAAKGLEFPHLYLVQTDSGSGSGRPSDTDLDERATSEGPWEYRLLGASSPGFHRVLEHRERVAAAEQVRTLYVAMTRARERLVLAGRWPTREGAYEQPREAARASHHLHLLMNREGLSPPPLELEKRATAEGLDRVVSHGTLWRFLGLGEIQARRERSETASPDWLPTPEAVEASMHRLEGRRAQAARRMERATRAAATEESGRLLDSLLDSDERREGGDSRHRALVAGTLVHQILEGWNLEADPSRELERQQSLLGELTALLPEEDREAVDKNVRESLERFRRGGLWPVFDRLRPHFLAREVPVLLPPGDVPRAPVGYVSGAVDALYRDPEKEEIVIVDFKTDRIEEREASARAAVYRPQERVYAQALRGALGLAAAPRTELWFLWPGVVWRSS